MLSDLFQVGRPSPSVPSGSEYDFSRAIWLPEPPEPVTLYLSPSEKLPGRVVRRLGNSLRVVPMLPVAHLDSQRCDRPVLEYANPCGRVRLTGTMTVEDTREGALLRIDDAKMIEAVQERAYPRVRADCPVVIYAGKKRWETRTVDLGGGGLLLAGPDELGLWDDVEFELTLRPGSLPVVGSARVTRIDVRRGCPAIQFTSISFSDRWRLGRFTLDNQRQIVHHPHSTTPLPGSCHAGELELEVE